MWQNNDFPNQIIKISLPILLAFFAFTSTRSISRSAGSPERRGEVGLTATLTHTPTPTMCPYATAEPLWVDPVISQTDYLTQTIVIYIGNGDRAGVTLETGVFTQTGEFNAYSIPAMIPVDLYPNTTHHLVASGHVKEVQVGGCPYGGYTLSTQFDRYGNPLTIVQVRYILNIPYISNGTLPGK